jgi:opacity protein-like surface antigen
MKIRNKIIALVISLIAMPTFAFSQAKNFAGPSLAVTGGKISSTTKVNYNDGAGGSAEAHVADIGGNDVGFGLDLSYAFAIDNNFLIGLGFTYGLNDTDAGTVASILKFKIEDQRSVYIQPTYAFNNSFAAYGKIGYHEMDGKATLTQNLFINNQNYGLAAGSASGEFKGIGYGFGLKGLINQNVYIQAEVQYVDYDSEGGGSANNVGSFKPETVSGIISIGYKF